MAVEYIDVKDGGGASKKIAVERVTVGADTVEVQAYKLLVGGDGVAPAVADDTNRAVTESVVRYSYTDRSGTLTTGGTAQVLMSSSSTRRKMVVLNPNAATESLWISFTGTATVGGAASYELAAGDAWIEDAASGVTTQAVSVIASTTGHTWKAMEAG